MRPVDGLGRRERSECIVDMSGLLPLFRGHRIHPDGVFDDLRVLAVPPVGEAGRVFLILGGDVCFFFGVVFLVGVAIFRVDERERESAIWVAQGKVEEVTENLLENRELIGSYIVCKDYLYVGDSIASCPRCKGMAHRG